MKMSKATFLGAFVSLSVIAFAAQPPVPAPVVPPELLLGEKGVPRAWIPYFIEAEERYGVNALWVASVAFVESSFSSHALSNKGARGLLQVLPETATYLWKEFLRTLPARDPLRKLDPATAGFNARLSVLLGTFYLSRLSEEFQGDWHLALAAYNAGPARVRKTLAERGSLAGYSRDYVKRVYGAYKPRMTVR